MVGSDKYLQQEIPKRLSRIRLPNYCQSHTPVRMLRPNVLLPKI